ncbi:MAG: efflux RND transporter periplasmic adaptor subunit [Reyranellaceae bacterium]
MSHLRLIPLAVLLAGLAACKAENKFQPPPPSQITVAAPLQQEVAPFEVLTGNTVSFATVDLVARVKGFLTEIKYVDGAYVKKGDVLFVIEQTVYKANLQEAQAQLAAAKAELVQSEADFTRQETLLRQNVSAQTTYDKAKAKRDTDRANVENAQANLVIAQTNLGYTTVEAPFDGIVSKHLQNVGQLVGDTSATKLATIVRYDPIYVEFNMSEQDVLEIRRNLGREVSLEQMQRVPIEIGLMDEEGFPHKGFLNYVSPELDPTTGTILVRGLFQNPDRRLVPGFFVRVHMPRGKGLEKVLLIPDRVIAEDQAGKYVLAVGKDDLVEERRVTTGQLLVGGLRVIKSGLKPDDRVVLSTNGRAVPGNKVVPKDGKIDPPPASAGVSTPIELQVPATPTAPAPAAPSK